MTRVLVTGGHGFVGTAICGHLRGRDHIVDSMGRGQQNEIISDLAAGPPCLPRAYDVVVHCAGKAHSVPKSAQEEEEFFDINLRGTQHLLNALTATALPDALVLVSTVAVYGRERGTELTEDEPLAASDPYGRSKAEAEDLVRGWAEVHGVRAAILRLPLVAGPNPPGNLGAMVEGIRSGRYLSIGGGAARRSIVHVEDVAAIVPVAAERGGTYNLAGATHPSFREVGDAIASVLGRPTPRTLPVAVARLIGTIFDGLERISGHSMPLSRRAVQKMTSTLTFSDGKAREQLGWSPRSVPSSASTWVATAP